MKIKVRLLYKIMQDVLTYKLAVLVCESFFLPSAFYILWF